MRYNKHVNVLPHLLSFVIYWIHRYPIAPICMTVAFTARSSSRSIEITQPSSRLDFMQLSKLIVYTFDNPMSSLYQTQRVYKGVGKDSLDNSNDNNVGWSDQDQLETERHTMEEYIQNVQRLQGYKYALWIAKEYDESPKGKQEGKIVGVVEVGLTTQAPSQQSDPSRVEQHVSKRPTIGVLCVDPAYQSFGVGSALIETCESLVLQIWKEGSVYVQVEPWNVNALSFFTKRGYQLVQRNQQLLPPVVSSVNKDSSPTSGKQEPPSSNDWKNINPLDIIMVRLYRNRLLQDIPHVLLVKTLS